MSEAPPCPVQQANRRERKTSVASRSPSGEDKLVVALLWEWGRRLRPRRGDKRHRHNAGLSKNGRRKNLPLPGDLYRVMGLPLPLYMN